MSRIFINYRRQDSEGYAGRLYDHLLRHFSEDDLFMDINAIQVGADFVHVLQEAVVGCDVLLAIIGHHWLNVTDEYGQRRLDQPDDFVRIEIAVALEQNKLVIPILVGGARMPDAKLMPDSIAALGRRNAYMLSHKNFAQDVDGLAEIVRQTVISTRRGRSILRDPATLREKEAQIKKVRDDVLKATDSPLYAHRVAQNHFPVIGDGRPDAALMLIGQSPTGSEAKVGRTFVGPSGDFLIEMLRSIGMEREDVFITNVVLDALPEKRDPQPQELTFYAPYVDRLIDIVQPRVIASLGGFAMARVLRKFDAPEKRGNISQLHGTLIQATASYGEVYIVPMFHPAVALYHPGKRDVLRQDFNKLKNFL